MKNIFVVAIMSLLLFSCGEEKKEQTEEVYEEILETEETSAETPGAREFWNSLKALCGKAFEGELMSAPTNDDFAGKRLVMHVLSCDDEQILIPFNVGDNLSRTWIFTYKNDRITLKHDHRKEDGSDDELTMYGGTSTNSGLPHIAVFPADEETLERIKPAATNVWWITVDENAYTYNLRRLGTERLFTVSFDLTQEVGIPEPSWGWEDFSNNE
jgi:hypothetical protein